MPPTDSSISFNTADFQLDAAAERFFSQPPASEEDFAHTPARLPRTQRRAMRATFAMLGFFAVALTGFLIYSRVLMPVPADLGADRSAQDLPARSTD